MISTTCPECGGVNGHRDPFCSKLDLKAILSESDEQQEWQPAIQVIEVVGDNDEAERVLVALRMQVDHLASRILEPTYYEPLRIQAIFETNGAYPNGWLPDGMKHVMWRGRF